MPELDRLIAELEARAAARGLNTLERAALLSLRTGKACVEALDVDVRRGPMLDFHRVSRSCWTATVEGLETVEVHRLPSGMWHIEPCSLLGYREVVEMATPFECMDVLELRLAQHARRAA